MENQNFSDELNNLLLQVEKNAKKEILEIVRQKALPINADTTVISENINNNDVDNNIISDIVDVLESKPVVSLEMKLLKRLGIGIVSSNALIIILELCKTLLK